MTKILSGKKLSKTILEEIKEKVDLLQSEGKRVPGLAVIMAGDNPASASYVKNKMRSCKKVGFYSRHIKVDKTITEAELLQLVDELNYDDEIDGFIVQLPLPDQIDVDKVISAIDPNKDVDGFHPMNVGNVTLGRDAFISATPNGIMEMLSRYNIDTEGKRALVIGRSNIVGRPMSILLSRSGNPGNATVTLAHSRTKELKELCLQSDIIVVALGKAHFLTADMVKEGAVVIDVGINRVEDETRKRGYRLVGDVDYKAVKEKASAITPVPGGVGPMTVCSLLMNTYKSYQQRENQ